MKEEKRKEKGKSASQKEGGKYEYGRRKRVMKYEEERRKE